MDESWEKEYQCLVRCSSEHQLDAFVQTVGTELKKLILCNEVHLLQISSAGKICAARVLREKWKRDRRFLDFCKAHEEGSQEIRNIPLKLSAEQRIGISDWKKGKKNVFPIFREEYLMPEKYRYSLTMGLCDTDGCLRCVISLEREQDEIFKEGEIAMLRRLHAILENLFIDLLLPPQDESGYEDFEENRYGLTRQESRIVGMLLDGMTPQAISDRLCISVKTVYRHIANIYKKRNVSSRQELILSFVRKEGDTCRKS